MSSLISFHLHRCPATLHLLTERTCKRQFLILSPPQIGGRGHHPAEIGIELRWVSFPPHPLNTGGWGAEQCTGRVLQSGGRGVPCWRDPRVPLQLVGASTTSNQPSLPPAGEESGPTKLPTHLIQTKVHTQLSQCSALCEDSNQISGSETTGR